MVSIYYALTTLTSVGFGDLHPINDMERLVVAFFMLFGISIFSLSLQELRDEMQTLKAWYMDSNTADDLEAFFLLLKKFNYNQPVDPQF